VENPSSFHVSFNAIDLHGHEAGSTPVSVGGGMVRPGESATFPLPKEKADFDAARVTFATINDFGAVVNGTAALEP
jgi:P pilus assembly chaperone PapD